MDTRQGLRDEAEAAAEANGQRDSQADQKAKRWNVNIHGPKASLPGHPAKQGPQQPKPTHLDKLLGTRAKAPPVKTLDDLLAPKPKKGDLRP